MKVARRSSPEGFDIEADKTTLSLEILAIEARERLRTRTRRKQARNCMSCGGPNNFTCARCGSAYYCGKYCQRNDWAAHKPECDQLV
jgi:hypothetical protein